MKVQDAMTRNPAAIMPAANLAAATELMWKHDCGSLPVTDDTGKAIGIVTDRDMLIAVGTRNLRPSEITVGEVMTSPVFTCRPTDTIDAALSKMNTRRIRRLVVATEDGKLAGMLTMNDIVLHSDRQAARDTAVPYDDVMMTLKGICDHGQQPAARPTAA